MTPGLLVQTSLVVACTGLLIGALGWLLALVARATTAGGSNRNSKEKLLGVAAKAVITGGSLLGFAALILLAASLWWGTGRLLGDITPVKLALLSVFIGLIPLLVSGFASMVAALLGGSISNQGARNCSLLGMDIGPPLYFLYKAYWFVFLTAGLGFVGLLVSAIWALMLRF